MQHSTLLCLFFLILWDIYIYIFLWHCFEISNNNGILFFGWGVTNLVWLFIFTSLICPCVTNETCCRTGLLTWKSISQSATWPYKEEITHNTWQIKSQKGFLRQKKQPNHFRANSPQRSLLQKSNMRHSKVMRW